MTLRCYCRDIEVKCVGSPPHSGHCAKISSSSGSIKGVSVTFDRIATNTHIGSHCAVCQSAQWQPLCCMQCVRVHNGSHCAVCSVSECTLAATAIHCNTLQHTATHCNTQRQLVQYTDSIVIVISIVIYNTTVQY